MGLISKAMATFSSSISSITSFSSSSATAKLLREALAIPSRNSKILLLLLLSSLSFSLLFLFNYLSISPILLRISLHLHVLRSAGPDTLRHPFLLSIVTADLKQFLLLESIFALVSFFISSFLQITIVCFAAAAYSRRQTASLESWKNPLFTQLLVAVLNSCYVFFSAASLSLFLSISDGRWIILAVVVALAMFLLYFYVVLSTAWAMSTVVSVEEGGCWGTAAMARGMELIKEKSKQAMVIGVIYVAANCAYYGVQSFSTAFVPEITPWPAVNGAVAVSVSSGASMLMMVAFTVLYCECRGSHGDEEMLMREGFAWK